MIIELNNNTIILEVIHERVRALLVTMHSDRASSRTNIFYQYLWVLLYHSLAFLLRRTLYRHLFEPARCRLKCYFFLHILRAGFSPHSGAVLHRRRHFLASFVELFTFCLW
ncbi:hypothetical protein BDV40DRAFT_262975 [Aspergillus tamarii]|uniref:Uncharacterized protein n=1 Tax=Aspergillus tamarii TaxID=41984 RepID=A0A5N6UY21_ASPTM|nr:hypothetical protein BDV40DRAFT_262975 [Aspergillus tamarii]